MSAHHPVIVPIRVESLSKPCRLIDPAAERCTRRFSDPRNRRRVRVRRTVLIALVALRSHRRGPGRLISCFGREYAPHTSNVGRARVVRAAARHTVGRALRVRARCGRWLRAPSPRERRAPRAVRAATSGPGVRQRDPLSPRKTPGLRARPARLRDRVLGRCRAASSPQAAREGSGTAGGVDGLRLMGVGLEWIGILRRLGQIHL